jgi:hypothetical protein
MAAIAGKGGSAKITGANTIAQVESWNLDIDGGLVDSHSLGDSWGESTQTIMKGTGSLNCRFDLPSDANGQTAINTAALTGATITDLRLYVNSTNYYSGNAKIESISIATAVEDLVTYTVNFRTEGAWAYA